MPYWICLEVGAQPMMSQDGRWITVLMEKIYNHLDIRNELQEHIPKNFRGHSDTETLIESIALGCRENTDKLNGMFAFAVWDQQEENYI